MYIFVDDEVKQWDGDFWNGLPYEWYSKLFIVNRPCNFAAVQVEADFGDIASGALEQERIDRIKAANQVVFSSGADLKGPLHATVLNTFTTNGSLLQDLPGQIDSRYVLLTVYADGQKVAELNIQNRNLYRLPSGFKADRWEFKVNGNIPLRHIKIAETAKELASL